VIVVVAARDEAQRIAATLAALGRAFPGAPAWVADDGSSDATAEIAERVGARVVRSERSIGKGGAVSAAARAALASPAVAAQADRDPTIFVLCDGDLADSASELGPLVLAVAGGQADLAVATFSRRVGGGLGLTLGCARWAIRRRCGFRARAPLSGQRALSRQALRDVLPLAHGYGMEVGMTIDAVRAGRRVIELELDLSHRASGRTPRGFLHRARQLADVVRVYLARA
jgi:glycosyltransferase involved in cell wall biosynthesis